MMKHLKTLLLVTAIAISGSIQADPLFEEATPLKLNLAAEFGKMFRQKDKSKQYPAKFLLDGEAVMDVMLEVRGNYRLDECQVPGLRVIFPEKQKSGIFKKQKKLKLVVPCRKDSPLYQDYVYQEYATYRAFETLTEKSFKTRLVDTTFVDTGADSSWESSGFFIEDKTRLGKRLNLKQVRDHRVAYSKLDPAAANLATMYQYLIGNTDFSHVKGEAEEACCHNAKLYSDPEAQTKIIPVPYDFDLAGIVNTRYAKPAPNMGIKKVTQRKYRGLCANNSVVPETIAHIKAQREQLYAAFLDEHISQKRRDRMTKFLDKFFVIAADQTAVQKKIMRHCRG